MLGEDVGAGTVLLSVVDDDVVLFVVSLLVEFVALFAVPELDVVALLLVDVPLTIGLELFDMLFWLCC